MNSDDFSLDRLVEELERQELPDFMQLPSVNPRPSRDAVFELVGELRNLLFPGYFNEGCVARDGLRYHTGSILSKVRRGLTEQVMRAICFRCTDPTRMQRCQGEARKKVNAFLESLPEIRASLVEDVKAAYRGDPAATSEEETVFSYPGLTAITFHRLAHRLYQLEVPLLARIVGERSHSLTGIDIHPGAQVGPGLFIDHGTGVVIGETSIIGANVRIYQGVTLGARSFPKDKDGNPIKGQPRHPIVEDDVIIYSGATVLGRITVGKGSIIGGNVWLTESVPPFSRVSQGRPVQEGFEAGAGI